MKEVRRKASSSRNFEIPFLTGTLVLFLFFLSVSEGICGEILVDMRLEM
jgi:hypothetical protein